MTIFKPLAADDRVSTKTLLHEAIPITGTIVSGTYGVKNVQNFTHGMFQSVYDYPYLSSSANHIFDITFGMHTGSLLYGTTTVQKAKKNNIYNQMAQVLMGHDATGSIMEFDEDGDIAGGGTLITECFFLNFSRLLTKDEIKKGSFSLTLGVSGSRDNPHQGQQIIIKDTGAATDYRINSPAGDYAILYAKDHLGNCVATTDEAGVALAGIEATNGHRGGLIFYQAGIVVVSGSVFQNNAGNSKGILSAADPGGSAADCKMQHPGSGDVRFSENGGNGLISSISISLNLSKLQNFVVAKYS